MRSSWLCFGWPLNSRPGVLYSYILSKDDVMALVALQIPQDPELGDTDNNTIYILIYSGD